MLKLVGVAIAAMFLAACGASSARPAACTGTRVMQASDGRCVPCGGVGQPCCPDEDTTSGPPYGAYCVDSNTDCLASDPPTAFGDQSCLPCGHVGERACSSGCVQGFPQARGDAGTAYCSCDVGEGMDPLPGCPGATSSAQP